MQHMDIAASAWKQRRPGRTMPEYPVVLELSGPNHPEHSFVTMQEWNASGWLCEYADRRADSITVSVAATSYLVAYFDDAALAMEFKLRWTGVTE